MSGSYKESMKETREQYLARMALKTDYDAASAPAAPNIPIITRTMREIRDEPHHNI